MWIKVCGLRDIDTAIAITGFAVDAIGLNFFSKSARYVDEDTAARIVRAIEEVGRTQRSERSLGDVRSQHGERSRTTERVGESVEVVGLFVNHSVEEVFRITRLVGLKSIQLHGDEPPEFTVEMCRHFQVTRAFRVGDEGLGPVERYLNRCRDLGAIPARCLIDAKVAGQYGGTGHTAPWDLLGNYPSDWPPLVLAGGLTPFNVRDAIRRVRAF